MLRALADEHVMATIVEALRRRGMDVETVQDLGRRGADDPDLLIEALAQERILLTNDTDFLALAADGAARGEPFAPIFFWPQQRRSIGHVVRAVIRESSRGDYASACSQVVYL